MHRRIGLRLFEPQAYRRTSCDERTRPRQQTYAAFGLQGQAFYSKNRSNSTKANFPEVDAALQKAWRSVKDEASRKAAYCNYVRAVVNQQPVLFRAHNNFAIIAGKKVKGLKKSNLTLSRLHEAWVTR